MLRSLLGTLNLHFLDLNIILPLVSVSLTLFLAGIGIEMANDPPASKRAKWIYRIMFGVVAFLIISVTYSQEKRNKDEQVKIQAQASQQTNEIQTQYNTVSTKLSDINVLVQHSSKLTPEQLANSVQTIISSIPKQEPASPRDALPNPVRSSSLSDSDLCAEFPGLIEELGRKAQLYMADYTQFNSIPVGTMEEQNKQMNERNNRKLQAGLDFIKYNRDLLNRADYLRDELELKTGKPIASWHFRDQINQQINLNPQQPYLYPHSIVGLLENMRLAGKDYCTTRR
jgi:hypothetical protein